MMPKRTRTGEERRVKRLFHESDGGFSAVGMALAMLIALSLVFSTAQVYRVQSLAADVQDVADAAALAAENQVASFYIVAQTCDAIVLSMSLTGIAVAGVGVVCLCIPPTAELSAQFIDAASKIFKSRDEFAENASRGLDKLQKLLPFLAAAQANAIAQANGTSAGEGYFGCAVLLPFQGSEIAVPSLEGADEAMDSIQAEDDAVRQAAKEAEDAAKEANSHKEKAWLADCGNDPGYCMYERASALAGLSSTANPYYGSVDAWSFSVAMRRAKAYYPRRFAQESPLGPSVPEQANSALRSRFYSYASREIAKGYVRENAETGSFDAYFPLLPKNTGEMRSTELYTERVYPVTAGGGEGRVLHAWSGCPAVQERGEIGKASISEAEQGSWDTCPECRFGASSMGKVAAASSTIENGFEYHYRIVAEEARAYAQAKQGLEPSQGAVKEKANRLLQQLSNLIDQAKSARIHVEPPGHYGAIAIVASTRGIPASSMFASGFVKGDATLGARAAISAATLARDDSDETKNVITSLLDGFREDPAGASAPSVVLGLWSALLGAYCNGQEALQGAVDAALNKIPLASASGLGTWCAGKLEAFVRDAGFEPAELHAYRPVLVNSAHVLQADSGRFAQALLSVKTHAASVPATDPALAGAVDAVGSLAAEQAVVAEEKLLIATVGFLGADGLETPFAIALPESAKRATVSVIESAFDRIGALVSPTAKSRIWE